MVPFAKRRAENMNHVLTCATDITTLHSNFNLLWNFWRNSMLFPYLTKWDSLVSVRQIVDVIHARRFLKHPQTSRDQFPSLFNGVNCAFFFFWRWFSSIWAEWVASNCLVSCKLSGYHRWERSVFHSLRVVLTTVFQPRLSIVSFHPFFSL